jgi:hypothetical protein
VVEIMSKFTRRYTTYARSRGRTAEEQNEQPIMNYMLWLGPMIRRFCKETDLDEVRFAGSEANINGEFDDWLEATVAMDRTLEERHDT